MAKAYSIEEIMAGAHRTDEQAPQPTVATEQTSNFQPGRAYTPEEIQNILSQQNVVEPEPAVLESDTTVKDSAYRQRVKPVEEQKTPKGMGKWAGVSKKTLQPVFQLASGEFVSKTDEQGPWVEVSGENLWDEPPGFVDMVSEAITQTSAKAIGKGIEEASTVPVAAQKTIRELIGKRQDKMADEESAAIFKDSMARAINAWVPGDPVEGARPRTGAGQVTSGILGAVPQVAGISKLTNLLGKTKGLRVLSQISEAGGAKGVIARGLLSGMGAGSYEVWNTGGDLKRSGATGGAYLGMHLLGAPLAKGISTVGGLVQKVGGAIKPQTAKQMVDWVGRGVGSKFAQERLGYDVAETVQDSAALAMSQPGDPIDNFKKYFVANIVANASSETAIDFIMKTRGVKGDLTRKERKEYKDAQKYVFDSMVAINEVAARTEKIQETLAEEQGPELDQIEDARQRQSEKLAAFEESQLQIKAIAEAEDAQTTEDVQATEVTEGLETQEDAVESEPETPETTQPIPEVTPVEAEAVEVAETPTQQIDAEATATPQEGGASNLTKSINTRIQQENQQRAERGEEQRPMIPEDSYSDAQAPNTEQGKAASAIGKLLGRKVSWVRNNRPKQATKFNGAIIGDTIYLDVDAADPFSTVISHEVTHSLKKSDPATYARLSKAIDKATNKGRYGKYKQQMRDKYDKAGHKITDAEIRDEFNADVIGDLGADPQFWADLAKEDRGVVQKIVDVITDMLNKVRSAIGNKAIGAIDTKKLEDVRKAAQDALRGLVQKAEVAEETPTSKSPVLERMAQGVSEEYAKQIEDKLLKVKTNAETLGEVKTILQQGIDKAESDYYNRGNNIPDATRAALGMGLAEHFFATKQMDRWVRMVEDLAEYARQGGQRSQIFSQLGKVLDSSEAAQEFVVKEMEKARKSFEENPTIKGAIESTQQVIEEAEKMLDKWIDSITDKPKNPKITEIDDLPDEKIDFSLKDDAFDGDLGKARDELDAKQEKIEKNRDSVAFEPNQIKLTTNQRPTEDPRIDFSLDDRKFVVSQAKKYGLPATGKTSEIADRVRIARTPTTDWTEEDFKKILPYLAMHQIRPDASIDGIKREGLTGGMTDPLGNFAKGTGWTWASSINTPTAILFSGTFKMKGDTPNVASSMPPIATIEKGFPIKRGEYEKIFEAIKAGHNKMSEVQFSLDDRLQRLVPVAKKIIKNEGTEAMNRKFIAKYGDDIKRHLPSIKLEAMKSLKGKIKNKVKADLKIKNIKASRQVVKAIENVLEKFADGKIGKDQIKSEFLKQFELPEPDKAILAKAGELGEKIGRAPVGSQTREDATRELLNEIQLRKDGVSRIDQLWSLWYANVLSGWRTHFRNIVETAGQIAFELPLEIVSGKNPVNWARNAALALGGGIKGAKIGLNEAIRHFVTGGGILGRDTVSKFGKEGVLELKDFKGGKFNPFNYAKFVGRALVATDTLFHVTASEAKSRLIALEMARTQSSESGEPLRGKELWNAVWEKLHQSENYEKAYREQAEKEWENLQEGDTTDSKRKWVNRRIEEIRRQARDEPMNERAAKFADRATFNYPPDGLVGVVGGGLGAAVRGIDASDKASPQLKALSRMGIPLAAFTRIASNVTNKAMDWTPWGIIRSMFSQSYRWNEDGQMKIESFDKGADRKAQELKKGVIGTAIMLSFLLRDPEDEDDSVLPIIHGPGPSSWSKRKQLMQTGWRQWTIQFRGKYYSYRNLPIALALVPIGSMHDGVRYGNYNDKEMEERFAFMLANSGKYLIDASYIRNLGDFLESFGDGPNADRKLSRFLRRTTTGFIPMPKLFRDLVNIADPYKRDREGVQATLLASVPVASFWNRPQLDLLGMKIENRPLDFIFTSRERGRDAAIWRMLAKHKKWIPDVYSYKSKLDSDTYYKFQKVRGQFLRENLHENLADLNELTGEEAKNPLGRIFRAANKYAENELGLNEE